MPTTSPSNNSACRAKYARPLARQGLENEIRSTVAQQYVPGRSRNVHVSQLAENLASEPVLLPVYIMAYRYQEKVYRFLVNGQTGKAFGDAPFSYRKLWAILGIVLDARLRGPLDDDLRLRHGDDTYRPGGGDRGPIIGIGLSGPDRGYQLGSPNVSAPGNPSRKRAFSPRATFAILRPGSSQAFSTNNPANMVREPILQQESTEAEPVEDRDLRPRLMRDMVGQRAVHERLQIAVDAARKREEPLGHILFDGPPGLGKTTFAMCIHRELDVGFQITSAPAINAPKDLVPYLTNASEGSVLFIDEIHRLPKGVEEYLYSAMEDFRVDIVLGEGTNARTMSIPTKPFTLIGATTRAGLLSAPLRDRFQIREHLDFYSDEELGQIVTQNAKKLEVEIDAESAAEIARRSRGTPRIANNRLRWIRDYATSRADGRITLEVTTAALEMEGIDTLGLGRQDRKYLNTIIGTFAGGPAGVEAIAHTMNVSADTLSDEVEPFLLRSGLVTRTPRGRVATVAAFSHLKLPAPEGTTSAQQSLPLWRRVAPLLWVARLLQPGPAQPTRSICGLGYPRSTAQPIETGRIALALITLQPCEKASLRPHLIKGHNS